MLLMMSGRACVLLMSLNDDRIYCTQLDILTSLQVAFILGNATPYELKEQELYRIFEGLVNMVNEKKHQKTIKKYRLNND